MARFRLLCSLILTMLAALLVSASGAGAAIAPPWCGTPIADAAASLPDGTSVGDPVGSFPHIPWYAIGCTLDSIAAQSGGRMTVEVIGQSALGRDMYKVTINALETDAQRRNFDHWQSVRRDALDNPAQAQKLVGNFKGNVKIPIFIQSGIHGNEYEGVDAAMQIIEQLATTPYGTDPDVDDVLDHALMVFNVVQNPDGRIAGTRTNGNGFDLNRDYLTQSQSETKASVGIMQQLLATEGLDLHGYATPTLIDGTTKPHNPGLEYDLFVKWNQPRLDANEAALNAEGLQMQRPVNDWCSNADLPPCPAGETPGPDVAEGWDDWGPFYTATYIQLTGVDGSTVEMCQSVTTCGGRAGARLAQYTATWSTTKFAIAHRTEMMSDQLEVFRRGVTDAARVTCCPAPIIGDHNWMTPYPQAYLIPIGAGQRSEAEAARLVRWLLFNGIRVMQVKEAYSLGTQAVPVGSYVVPLNQALRGLADTALNLGTDISSRIFTLYAPPAAWSHGYLWGADVVTVNRGVAFSPKTKRISQASQPAGGVESGAADNYALEVDSATAVRTLNSLVAGGVSAQLALSPFAAASSGTLPAGSAIFGAADAAALAAGGQANGLVFRRLTGPLPAVDPIEGVPRVAVLVNAVDQSVWSLRNLGFPADPVATGSTSALNNAAGPNPLADYDVVFNTANWPGTTAPTSRARLTAFFAGGGGYIGAGTGGANFLNATSSGQFPGLATTSQSGGGQSGIFYWTNTGGAASPIVGSFPAQDTAIMDPPTWFSTVPATASIDGRLLGDTTSTFASGLWRLPRDASAANAPIIVHGTSTAAGSTARITAFSLNPLYRADPEREWPAVGSAAYWADQ